MKNPDLEKTVVNAIRAAIKADIRERMPKTFYELYYDTLTNVTSKFYWYDKHLLRQKVVIILFENFPKLLNEDYLHKLNAIWKEANQERDESNRERRIYNHGNSEYI